MFYFICSIALIGAVLAFGIAVPLLFFGFPRKAEQVMCSGITLLMRVQPWLHAKVILPEARFERPIAPGMLIIANHRSHLDVFFLLASIPRVRVLAKRSLFRVPILAFMMRQLKQIAVGSGASAYLSAMEEAMSRLTEGETVAIFPETTRCLSGFEGVQAFSLLPFQTAIQAKTKILPVVFSGTDQAWAKNTNFLSSQNEIRVESLQVVDAALFTSAAELRDEVVQQIQRNLLT